MNELDKGFQSFFKKLNSEEWSPILEKFSDANIFQTYEYGAQSWGDANIDHFLLKCEQQIVAAAQIWIKKIPLLNRSIAHVSYGPLWIQNEKTEDISILKNALRALHNEYVEKRKFLLRLRPNIIENPDVRHFDEWINIFEEQKITYSKNEYRYRTIRLDLTPELDEIKKNFKKNWRRYLRKSENNSLEVKRTVEEKDFSKFRDLYENMVNRKQFSEYIEDVLSWNKINNRLPENLKMHLFLSVKNLKIISGIVISKIGNTALGLLSATGKEDIDDKLFSTYFLDWEIIKYLKSINCSYYDLRGYSPETFPGPSHYKAGLGGDDVRFIGLFEASNSHFLKILFSLGKKLDKANSWLKSLLVKAKQMVR